jgi:enoyl-[acyl-carrier protein] reductase II
VDSIRTRISALFGVRYPIVQGGMIWASGWRLAAAVSSAGALGLIGAGSMTPAQLAEHIDKARAATDLPFGVNVPVNGREAEARIEIALERGVRIFFTSAGSPTRFTSHIRAAGGAVAHVVPSAALARKVEAAGCDAVVAEGTEAGGHNGFEEITSAVLWPSVAAAVRIPVIAAGGIVDGAGFAAALALGAEGAQVGTRFAVAIESSASEAYKAAAVASGEAAAVLVLRRHIPTRALLNPYVRRALAAEAGGAGSEELATLRGFGRARAGIFEGDVEEGELEIGQAAARLEDVPSAAEIVERMVREFRTAAARLSALAANPEEEARCRA